MPINLTALNTAPRMLIEAALKPIAGTRIQPTGLADARRDPRRPRGARC
jgi:hypothetical protein